MNTTKITVNGKEYTLLFGYTCYTEFMTSCFRFKETFLTDEGELTGLAIANLLHSAYLSYCYDKRQNVVLRYDDLAEWVSDQYRTEEGRIAIAECLETWAASKELKKLKEEVEKKSPLTEESLQSQTLTT